MDSLSDIALSGASKLASTYFTLFYRSVHVLYTGIYRIDVFSYNVLNSERRHYTQTACHTRCKQFPVVSTYHRTPLLQRALSHSLPHLFVGGRYGHFRLSQLVLEEIEIRILVNKTTH